MKAQLNFLNELLVVWSSRIFKTFGLVVVALALVTISNNHLAKLRAQNSALPPQYVTAAEKMKQLECLTRNIYWEAASEPFEGKVGVAQVTINRVESGKFADSICGVVYQKNICSVSATS